jgi:hypothetical protein
MGGFDMFLLPTDVTETLEEVSRGKDCTLCRL